MLLSGTFTEMVRDVLIIILLFPLFLMRLAFELWWRFQLQKHTEGISNVDSFEKEFGEHIKLIAIRPGRKIAVLHIPSPLAVSRGLLIFVHGACARMGQFENQIRHFSRLGYEIVACSALGCLLSDVPSDPTSYTSHQMYQDMVSLIERYTTERGVCATALIGHSLGGAMVNLFNCGVSNSDKRVLGTISIVPPHFHSVQSFEKQIFILTLPIPIIWLIRPYLSRMARKLLFSPTASSHLIEQEREASSRNPIYMFRAFYRGLDVRMFLFDNLPTKLSVPALFLGAELDKVCLVDGVRAYANRFGSKLVVSPRGGHLIMQECAEFVNTAIFDFIQ